MCSPRAKALSLKLKTLPKGTIAGSMVTLKEGCSSSERETGGEKHPHIQEGTEVSPGHMAVTPHLPLKFPSQGLSKVLIHVMSCVQGSR